MTTFFELFDAKAAAFCMCRGHKLEDTCMDETGRVLFQFQPEGLRETLHDFVAPGTQVEIQTYNAHYRYLMSIIEQYKIQRASAS